MPTVPGRDAVIHLTLGTNNVFLLPDEDGLTAVDAGPDYEGSWAELCAAFGGHGYAPADVHTVLLTHSHLDHSGLAARWQSVGACVLIGRADAPALAMDDAARQQERALGRAVLLRNGVPAEALAGPPGPGERYTRWPSPLRMTAVQADGLLDGGDVVSRGGRTVTAFACPGHTPGTMLFIDGATGAIFTGDHVLPRMAPTTGIQFQGEQRRPSLPVYLASLKLARDLRPEGVTGPVRAYPGHGEPIAELAEEVDWTVRFLEQRARRTLAALRRGPGTAHDLALRMFPHLGPRHVRPVMAETLGLLDLLAERGEAAADEAAALVVWNAVSGGAPA